MKLAAARAIANLVSDDELCDEFIIPSVFDRRVADGHPVAWIHATALRTEPLAYSGRDQVNPQKLDFEDLCGIADPLAHRGS